MSYHFSPFKWLLSERQKRASIRDNGEKLELSYIVGRKAKWCSHYEKQYTKN